jgi:hypothetical protein
MTLNMAVLAQIPNASVSTAATANLGEFRVDRVPYRISCSSFSIMRGHLVLDETSARTRCYANSLTKFGHFAAVRRVTAANHPRCTSFRISF